MKSKFNKRVWHNKGFCLAWAEQVGSWSFKRERKRLLDFLLHSQLSRVTTLFLTTVDSSWRKTSVTSSADLLVLVVRLSQNSQVSFDVTSSQSQYQVQGRFFLDVVVTQSSSIFQLLTSEDQSLLIRWNSFLVLDLSLNIVDGVRWFHIQSDGFPSKGLYEDLHDWLLFCKSPEKLLI